MDSSTSSFDSPSSSSSSATGRQFSSTTESSSDTSSSAVSIRRRVSTSSSSSCSFVSVESVAQLSSPNKALGAIVVVIPQQQDVDPSREEDRETEISTRLQGTTLSLVKVQDVTQLSATDEVAQEAEDDHSESESSTSTSDELDICSSKFNPLKALYSPFFPLDPAAPVFDNVEKFVSVYEGRGRDRAKAAAEKAAAAKQPVVKYERQFLPEQMPIVGHRKEHPDVMKYMTKQEKGPMSVLSRCVRENVRVKVYVRGLDRIRGYCTGFVVAFDKHWNMALVDVDEQYTRRRFRKTISALPIGAAKKSQPSSKSTDGYKTEQVGASIVRLVKCRRKTELCIRHVPQVVLRGEHVAMVCVL